GVVDQAAAGDVGDAVDDPLDAVVAIDRLQGADVDPGRLQELVGDRPAQLRDERLGGQAGVLEGDPAGQAVAVGVEARAGQADAPVPRADLGSGQDMPALDDAEAEPGQVVLAGLIELGQDRRLAADQGALGLDAAVADPLDDLGGQVGVV